MEILIKALQLITSLSILVIIHELGHFIPAKIFNTKVEKFYLFFNPWFSLFKYKRGDTIYGIGWVPLGGYVKIAGMIDESMDKEQMKQPPKPYEFRSKPSWQRLIMMLGGVLMNIFLAIFIYIIMLTAWGEEYLPTSQVKHGIVTDSLGKEMGLKNGDIIVSVDGEKVEDFMKIPAEIILEKASTVQVIRNGEKKTLEIPEGFLSKLIRHQNPAFIFPRTPFVISDFVKNAPAEKAGMEKGDIIIGINDTLTPYYDQFRSKLKSNKEKSVDVLVLRDNDTLSFGVELNSDGLIGAYNQGIDFFFDLKKNEYNFFQAIPAGTVKAFENLKNYVKQFKLIFSKETKGYESVGGFIAIGNFFPSQWNWADFWNLTAFLSIMLAFLNVLPIPALDGGHVLFLLYEMITGKKPGEKFMEYAQIIGLSLLFLLVIYANGNDIIKLFR